MGDLQAKEQQVDVFAGQGDTQSAVTLLIELVRGYAEKKDFTKAEAMRQRIFEVDDMALSEIVEAAEIIDQEKNKSIDRSYTDLWAKWSEVLSKEELNAFYFALEDRQVQPNTYIFKQGEVNDALYFLNSGQLKLVYAKDRREVLLRTLGPGVIAGEDSFFSISVCTVSLVTLTHADIGVLSRKAVEDFSSEYPGILPKLKDYCFSLEKAKDVLEKKGMTRREFERFAVEGTVKFQIVNQQGKAISNEFKGMLSDVSSGGLSLYIKSSNPKNAKQLLGRRLTTSFSLALKDGGTMDVMRPGLITGVISHMFNDYSVHVKFDQLLEPGFHTKIVRSKG